MKLQNHSRLTTALTSRVDGLAVNKVEIYAIFTAPCDLTWYNQVEKTTETAKKGDKVSVGQKGQCQPLKFPDGSDSSADLYVMDAALSYGEATAMMTKMVGEAKVAKLVVSEDKVNAALTALAEANPGFDASTVTVNWFRANRRYLAWRVSVPAEVRKESWGTDAYSGAAPETGILVVNPGIESYALQRTTDLPGWYAIDHGFNCRGDELFELATTLSEDFLQQFVS